jgi:hypothetical protein
MIDSQMIYITKLEGCENSTKEIQNNCKAMFLYIVENNPADVL